MTNMGLRELAQISEQEHMRAALARAAARQARRDAGITWLQAMRLRLFTRGAESAPATAPPAAKPAPSSPAPAATHPAPAATTPAATVRMKLRVIRAADPDCVGADC